MVGNLADLTFDGQSAITQRGLRGSKQQARSERRCNYVGNSSFQPGAPENDPAGYEVYSGPKSEFLGLAPWVEPDGPRAELRATAAQLERGSGAARENDYLETAIVADLPFPVDRTRPSCNGGSVTVNGTCANLRVGSNLGERLAGSADGDRIRGLLGPDRIAAGPGADCVDGGGGRDVIRCGSGRDVVVADGGDRVARSCERVRS